MSLPSDPVNFPQNESDEEDSPNRPIAQPGEVTQLLIAWDNGDDSAKERLMPLIYSELHRIAVSKLRREQHNITLSATALINEAFVQLLAWQTKKEISWRNRGHFYGTVADMMLNVLVERARKIDTAKRGKGLVRVTLNEAENLTSQSDLDLIIFNDALSSLSLRYPQQSQIVKLRCIVGLSAEDTAQALDISPATVYRGLDFAKMWLLREMAK